MTTAAQAREAEKLCQQQQFALRHLLKVDQAKASAEDMTLIEKMQAARTPAEFDASIHTLAINRLFVRGVIYIGEKQRQ